MDLKTILKQSYIVLFLRLCGQKWQEMVFCLKYMATGHMGKSEKKLMTNLTIQAHALEKGMSIGHVRTGFGKKKAISLLKGLENLVSVSTMNRKGYITEIVSIIYQYIRFNNGLGANMEDIELRLKRFCSVHHIRPLDQGGIIRKRLTDTQQMLESDFRLFSQTRFSVRDFGTTPISIEAIKNALKLCERTPSACNRQSIRVHVYTDKTKREELFEMQGGCKGFHSDMQCAILLCSDMYGYEYYEQSLPYVDGGLYAMNLLYALHREGLAAIPLTLSRKNGYLERIKKKLKIQDSEVPVLLIGVGSYKTEYRVAVSRRKQYMEYTEFT